MYSSRLVFSRHCAFPSTLQSLLQASPLSTTPSSSPLKSSEEKERPKDFIHPILGADAHEATAEKPSLLKRLEMSLDSKREKLEKEWLDRHEAGLPSRITPEMRKKFNEFQSSERNLQQRDLLLKEAFRKGYFDDAKEIAKKGAKLWEASKILTPAKVAKCIPNASTTSLTNVKDSLLDITKKYKMSLVTFVFSAFGEPQVKSFIDPFLRNYSGSPEVGLIQLNVQENRFKAPVVWMLKPLIRLRIPKEHRETYLFCTDDLTDERTTVGMKNSAIGWVNLVDSQGRIRWQAHGNALEHELVSLMNLSRQLLDDETAGRSKTD